MLCPETPIRSVLANIRDLSDEEVRAMWYDWFCADSALVRKGRALLRKLKSISPSPLYNVDRTYVFFKNNCPLHGRLYDDFRICWRYSGDVIFCVVPSEGYDVTKGDSTVWGAYPEGTEFRELVRGSWSDVVLFFQTQDENIRRGLIADAEFNVAYREASFENQVFDKEHNATKLWNA